MDLDALTLPEAAELLDRRALSAEELTWAYLSRIERLNPVINAYLTVTPEVALGQAREVDRARTRGEPTGKLAGLPLALKDLFQTRGLRTTAGSPILADYIPAEDCQVYRSLRGEGGVLLGKLNMHEWAFGVTNENRHFGDCRNPWDLERVSGGSSGGSGAALAAGLCLGAMGSDTGGSIRIPASFCGVVGLKPTYGRVSLRGVIPLSWNLDHAGPMGRCVTDVAWLYRVIAGFDPGDPVSVDTPVEDPLPSLEAGVEGWRVALARDAYFNAAAPEVQLAVRAAAETMETLGARIEEIPFPGAEEAQRANVQMLLADAATYHQEYIAVRPMDFDPDILKRLTEGAAQPVEVYVQARRAQSRLRADFRAFFAEYDLLLTATTPSAAPKRGTKESRAWAPALTRFTAPFNLTRLPALSMLCGFDSDGLPIGLQMIAAPWEEARLLRAARAYEAASVWHRRRPVLPS